MQKWYDTYILADLQDKSVMLAYSKVQFFNATLLRMVLPLGLEPRSSSNLEAKLGYKPSALPIELREYIDLSLQVVTVLLNILLDQHTVCATTDPVYA